MAAGLAADGFCKGQWATGVSAGSGSAMVGGERHRFELEFFDGAYETTDPASGDHPVYGALDLLQDEHGGAPRLGSCFLAFYDGDDSFARKLLKDPDEWQGKIAPEIAAAARTLSSYHLRSVHVVGSLRHLMWFAVGRALPEVKKWSLSTDQVNGTWNTSDPPVPAKPRILSDQTLDSGTELAIGIGLTGDPTTDIERHLRETGQAVGGLVVFGPESEPSPTAVPSGPWAMAWTRAVRNQVRAMAGELGALRIHLYTMCPSGVALMLGHQWNTMSTSVIYEFSSDTYHPTITLPGDG